MGDGARHYVIPNSGNRCGLTRGNRGEGPAAPTRHNHGLALACLFLGQAAIHPLGLDVLLLGFAAEIGAVGLDRTG